MLWEVGKVDKHARVEYCDHMLHLHVPTRSDWLPVALADFDTLLLDHAHCEMKAVASAESFARRYPDDPTFVQDMQALAAEERNHFAQVRRLLIDRGLPWRAATQDAYVAHLLRRVQSGNDERRLDRLLIASIIEARSCERFGLLVGALHQPKLRAFYQELFGSEARHHRLFLDWARHFAGRVAADRRLDELLAHEAAYVSQKAPTPHVHG